MSLHSTETIGNLRQSVCLPRSSYRPHSKQRKEEAEAILHRRESHRLRPTLKVVAACSQLPVL